VILPEFVVVPTRDGFDMEALLFKPAGFEEDRVKPGSERLHFPVVMHVYGGPHAQKAKDLPLGFDGFFHSMLAQRGYAVFVCDNRSASGKGLDSAKGIYRDAGSPELQDILDGLDWLVTQGIADPARVAIWGWSYGGYMTAFAMTHSDRFKVGIAGAPVTDWRLYDSIYTERYMDKPLVNAKGYDRSSVLEAAASLSGKLLLVHGVIDENVHVQNSLNFAEKLQLAGIPFQLMLYPGNRHPVVEPAQKRHLYSMMAQFIYDNL
jgi:dipeptidyl-peptidase 4